MNSPKDKTSKKLEQQIRDVWQPAKDILYDRLQEFTHSVNIIPNEESREQVLAKINEIKEIVEKDAFPYLKSIETEQKFC